MYAANGDLFSFLFWPFGKVIRAGKQSFNVGRGLAEEVTTIELGNAGKKEGIVQEDKQKREKTRGNLKTRSLWRAVAGNRSQERERIINVVSSSVAESLTEGSGIAPGLCHLA